MVIRVTRHWFLSEADKHKVDLHIRTLRPIDCCTEQLLLDSGFAKQATRRPNFPTNPVSNRIIKFSRRIMDTFLFIV